MPCDVLEEHPAGPDFADDPGDVGPEVPLVVFALSLPGLAERLAWVSGKDGVDRAAHLAPVEGGDIIPDGGRGEVSGELCGDNALSGVLVPFDKASRVGLRFGQHEAHIEATGSGAQ